MKIGVGTENPGKLAAVEGAVPFYPVLWGARVVPIGVTTSVGSQPKSREQTLRGARERAEAAYRSNEIGIGIESGVYRLAGGTMLDECACIIFDGRHHYLGISPAFVVPPEIARAVESGLELNDAFRKAGLCDDPDSHKKSGVVERLTGGRMNRAMFIGQALTMALAQYEHPELYDRRRRVVVSICSRQKSDEPGGVPARLRYKGSHIAKVEEAARAQRLPFFVLSGKLGLLHSDGLIEPYDYRLEPVGVPGLVQDLREQLKKGGIGEIRFYTKRKPDWEPYYTALNRACALEGVGLVVRELGDDD